MRALGGRYPRFLFALIAMIACLCSSAADPARPAGPDPAIPGVGTVTVFEGLRAVAASDASGYVFTISPDERWILTVDTFPTLALRILHLPTMKVWTRTDLPADSTEWYPACFSPDSKTLWVESTSKEGRYGVLAARLAPEMSALEFVAVETPTGLNQFQATFLGFPGYVKDPAGKRLRGWSDLLDGELASAKYAWSRNDSVLYDVVQVEKRPLLRMKPPGVNHPLDVASLMELEKREDEQVRIALQEAAPKKDAREVDELLASILGDSSSRHVTMDLLSVSPDGKLLAAAVEVRPSSDWSWAVPAYGVVIPLNSSAAPLVVRPFSRNVYHRMLWSEDSKRLYYYAQPQAGGGNGTVHRLEVKIPDPVPRPSPR